MRTNKHSVLFKRVFVATIVVIEMQPAKHRVSGKLLIGLHLRSHTIKPLIVLYKLDCIKFKLT